MPKFFLDRRQFTLGAAALATSALISPAESLAQSAGNAAELDEKTRIAMDKLSAQARAEVEAKVANIFRKYGDRLSEVEKADIRRIMAESQEGLEKMRAFQLENSDQPADAFRAYVSEAPSHPAGSRTVSQNVGMQGSATAENEEEKTIVGKKTMGQKSQEKKN